MIGSGAVSLVVGSILLAIFGLDLGPVPVILIAFGIKIPIFGFLYLHTNPVTIHGDHLEMKNLFGMTMRKVPFGDITKVDIRENRVYYQKGSEWKKLPQLKRKSLHPEDWHRFVTWSETGELPLKPKS